ncbi:hypothetical protein IFR05_008657 [Cadophora sp. M221]|nr:hypothetical protein IFR05_008657 [Cadophora sp. M221]
MSTPSKKIGNGGDKSSSNTPSRGNSGREDGSGRDRGRSLTGSQERPVSISSSGSEEGKEDDDSVEMSTRDPRGIYLDGHELDLTGPNSRRVAEDCGKHRPVSDKGTKFHWDANGHVSKDPPALGVKSKAATEMILYDEMDLKDLQRWRLQMIKRKLNQNNDGQSQKTDFRPHWSHEEKDFLHHTVLEAIKSKKRILSRGDWGEVAKEFNKRFNGYTIPAGESLPRYRKTDGTMTKGGILKLAHALRVRQANAIRSQAFRYPDLVKTMENGLVAEGQATDAGETPSDSEESSDSDDESESDESDDEEDE